MIEYEPAVCEAGVRDARGYADHEKDDVIPDEILIYSI